MGMDTAASGDKSGNFGKPFRPIVFLLTSHTPDNLDALTIANLLKPRFKKDDFYVVDISSSPEMVVVPVETKKNTSSEASFQNAASALPYRVSAAVQSALAKIDASRQEALRALEAAREAELSALQAEYIEDGLSAEEALAAAHTELRERYDAEEDDGVSLEEDGNDSNYGGPLPPCVCVVGVPLLPAVVARLARDVTHVSSVVLLESPCTVRELAAAPGSGVKTTPINVTGAHAPTDRVKGRGASANSSGSSLPNAALKQQSLLLKPGASAEEVLAVFRAAALAQPIDTSFQDVLLEHVVYPTEGVSSTSSIPPASGAVRPTIAPAQFLTNVETVVLRILSSWVRYDAWRANRSLVQVPLYTPLIDSEAALLAAASEDAAAAAAEADKRSGKRKSGSPVTSSKQEKNTPSPPLEIPTTAPNPRTMGEVAAEQFEYIAYMQRCVDRLFDTTTNEPLSAGTAVQLCLHGCVHQVASSHCTSTLRTLAETSAAQLAEDVASASSACRTAVVLSSGAPLESAHLDAALGRAEGSPVQRIPTFLSGSAKDTLTASSVEEALSLTVTAHAGSDVLPSVSAAVVIPSGSGDALHWMRDALLSRDQQGWHVATQQWEETVLYCLHQSTAAIGAPRTQHAVFLLDCHTTFPRFFHEESFLEEEGRHYTPSSLGDETDEDEFSESETDSVVSPASTASAMGDDKSDAATDGVAAKATFAISGVQPSLVPKVDHIDIVHQHLRRRRVLEQVRLSHSRLPVQELLGCDAPCRSVVTETQWMRAVDGTVVEVDRTAANSAQVRCTIIDAPSELQAGFMLECPPSLMSTSAEVTSPNSKTKEALPQPIVVSGVRGFLSVGRQLTVMTEVVADNTRAAAQAAHAAAVAAAKEEALAQYEAQFRTPGKPSRPRDKAAPGSQLTLEQITETLLAAVPPAPPLPSEEGSDSEPCPVPRVMRIHARFHPHDCVMTVVTSPAGTPGIQLRCLPPTLHCRHLARRQLLTVHVWMEGLLSVTEVTHLQAVRVYIDGVVEVLSPDLPPGVRLLLYKSGGYVTNSDVNRLHVSPDGRMTLHESTQGAPIVSQLQHGYSKSLKEPTVGYVDREDGMQLETVNVTDGDDSKRVGLIPSKHGGVRCIRFGGGVRVEQGNKEGTWLWSIAGIPTVHCDAGANEISVAVGEDESYRFAYQPQSSSFSLVVRDGEAEDFRVAASVAMSSCRISVFTQGYGFTDPAQEQGDCRGVFAVDCAYGGAYGRVGAAHVYRISPFGRCFEEVVQSGEPQCRQLVLPQQYKKPKKAIAEAVLLPEYANPLFHNTLVGGEGAVKAVDHREDSDPLHLQLSPLLPLKEFPQPSARTKVFPCCGLTAQQPGSSAALQVRCIALRGDSAQFTVLDAVSWREWVMWWQRHSSWVPQCSSTVATDDEQAGTRKVYRFSITKAASLKQNFLHSPEAGEETPLKKVPVVQGRLLLQSPPEESSTPAWCATGTLVTLTDVESPDVPGEEEGPNAAQLEVDNVNESPKSAPVSPTEMERSEDAQAVPSTRTSSVSVPPGSSGRKAGFLNYWSSPLCPKTFEVSVQSVTAESHSTQQTTQVPTSSPIPDAGAVESLAAQLLKAPDDGSKLISSPAQRIPLMHSYHLAADELTGTCASSRYHTPALEVYPTQVEFGNVLPGRRYMATVKLTNISTVPCRYRVRVGAEVRPFVSVLYSRQFVAPGLTTEMQIELSGAQPYGVSDSEIIVVHEGGTVAVNVWWCTTDKTHSSKLGNGIVCLGWTLHKPTIQHPFASTDDRDPIDEEDTLSDSDVTEDICVA